MASAQHRSNMLEPQYSEVGFAVVTGMLEKKPTTLVVALYGTPKVKGVAAATQSPITTAETGSVLGPLSRFGVGMQSMTPALLGAIILLSFAAGVALMAQLSRHKLPKTLRQSWYRHHGAVKAGGMVSLVVVMLAFYSGGQI
jgi:hypothetical protein